MNFEKKCVYKITYCIEFTVLFSLHVFHAVLVFQTNLPCLEFPPYDCFSIKKH